MSVADAPKQGFVGQRLRRKEDPRLITGRGKYTDDITPQGTLWCAFVRSTEAHARIVSVDTSEAKQIPGVHAVFTGEDLEALGVGGRELDDLLRDGVLQDGGDVDLLGGPQRLERAQPQRALGARGHGGRPGRLPDRSRPGRRRAGRS